jgi:hypothetical protein
VQNSSLRRQRAIIESGERCFESILRACILTAMDRCREREAKIGIHPQ